MRFHIGLSLNWKTLKKRILPILIGILVFLGLSSVNAASTTSGTMTWTNTGIYNTSTSSYLIEHNCPGSYSYSNNACSFQLLYPDQSLAKNLEYRFGFSDPNSRPYYIEANKKYKIILNVQGPLDYQNLTFNYQNVDDVYGAMVTPESVSYANGTLIVTFSRTFNTYINSLFFYIPLTTTGTPGEQHTYSVGRSFSITDTTDTDDVIIDQNQVIIDQNKETNDKLEDLEDSITNPDIESGTGNDFFDNFQTEDNGGISGIITAPLTLINSLLDGQGTCTDLKFPIMGKEVALPSGCIIWDKLPNEMEVLIQTLVCGTGAYFLLRQLFKDIEKLKNPNSSEVSTLDL